jgi:prenyltransferase beta subunit
MALRSAAALTVAATLAALAACPAGPAGAVRVDARASAAARSPTAYLLAAQNRDGGFGAAPGQRSSTLYSGWAALGLAAKGHNPGAVSHGGPRLLSYIERHVATDAASLERTILVARAAGVSATQFGGHDLVAALDRDINADGSVQHKVDLTTFAVLALRAAGVAVPSRTIRWLIRQQNRSGGFSYTTAGARADVDDTGAALQAIAASDRGATRRAVHYIRATQNRDGGFPSEPGGDSNAQSTAWAVQGLIAARVEVSKVRHRGSPSPRRYLESLITRSGAINYARRLSLTPVWVTAEAVMALAGKSLPLSPTSLG